MIALLASTAAFGAQASAMLDRQLVQVLEHRFVRARIDDWATITGLVVAGGSMARVTEALRLARRHPHLTIVLSGPGDEEIRAAAQAVGVDPLRVTVERAALNTYQNALLSKAAIAPQPGDRWLLVTSASHMPRAIGSFYGAGFHVEPWPVHDLHGAAAVAHVARHEWLGLIAYWLRGRTIALLPGQGHVDRMRTGYAEPVRHRPRS